MKASAAVVASWATVVFAAGCTVPHPDSQGPSGPIQLPENGPLLYPEEESATVCTTAKKHTRFMVSTSTAVAPGHKVRIITAEPFDAEGVLVEGVYVVPILGKMEMLVDLVPPDRPESAKNWAARRPASGAVVDADEHVQVAAVVRVEPASSASLAGIQITYTDLGTNTDYLTKTNLALRVEPEVCGP